MEKVGKEGDRLNGLSQAHFISQDNTVTPTEQQKPEMKKAWFIQNQELI